MDYWHDIPAGDNAPDEINVVVEIPKGSQNKYEYDKKYAIFRMDRVLFSPMIYPGDYGMIPQTLGEDGDPLDALVLITHPTYPGTLMSVRPIGVLHMQDDGERDDKILCVPVNDIRMEEMSSVKDVKTAIRQEIAHFFQVYKELEGKRVIIGGWDDAEKAKEIINDSIKRYQERKK
ncbi:MAG: inorganic diphosphatase [Candidatus Andersenbacteria bacterium]